MSTVLSTPGRQEAIGGRYLDIGMGGHFEGFGVMSVGPLRWSAFLIRLIQKVVRSLRLTH